MKKLLLASVLVLVLASGAVADTPALSLKRDEGALEGFLCLTQTATGACTSGGDEIVSPPLQGYTTITLDATASTATTYTCDLFTSWLGHDLDSGNGFDRTTTALTNTQETVGLSDGGWTRVWIECTTITGGNITVKFFATR